MFDDISGTYDLLNKVLSFNTDKRWRQKAVSLLPHGKEDRILDLASGTLDLALAYADQGPGDLYCLDFSFSMLQNGLPKLPPANEKFHLICGDGMNLPFPDQFFDSAMCAYGMRNLVNNRTGLSELYRTLKPRGKLLLLEFFKPSTKSAKFFAATYGKLVVPTIGKFLSKNQEAYSYLSESIQGFYTIEEYQKLMEQAGFSIIKSSHLTGGVSSLILACK